MSYIFRVQLIQGHRRRECNREINGYCRMVMRSHFTFLCHLKSGVIEGELFARVPQWEESSFTV